MSRNFAASSGEDHIPLAPDHDHNDEVRSQTSSQFSDSSDSENLKGADIAWIPVFCTSQCCCHVCYVLLFLAYVAIFPLWCKWMLTAPMPFLYWEELYPDFPRMPLARTNVALAPNGGEHQILMTEIPSVQSACNYSCGEELNGYSSALMNFNLSLRLNSPSLTGEVQTTYPVLLASEDFEDWIVVADRRNAEPRSFFGAVSEASGIQYESAQDKCSRPPGETGSVTSGASYILACVTWNSSSWSDLKEMEDPIETSELTTYCDVAGGVCGWPCRSHISSNWLPHCSASGEIEEDWLRQTFPGKPDLGRVVIQACESESADRCYTRVDDFSAWPCHYCVLRSLDERRLQTLGLPPGLDDVPGMTPGMPGTVGGTSTDSDEEEGGKVYRSLPRLMTKLKKAKVPRRPDILSAPRTTLLQANSLEGPWTKLYTPYKADSEQQLPALLGEEVPEEILTKSEEDLRTMDLVPLNEVSLTPTSCFGRRGPLYLVACAVNQSSYDDLAQWKNSKQPRFSPGQKVMPPPFNDRCVAVAGRCGYACETGNPTELKRCRQDGYIPQHELVGKVHVQYNRTTPVFLFCYVLLFGFAVKTIMLCPGIFTPYKRCTYYSADLTEQFRYILVVGVTGGGDEGKGTMVRNLVGMVSGLPPSCRCRYIVCSNEEGHRMEMLDCWEKFCNILGAVPTDGGQYEIYLRDLMKLWVEDTRSIKLSDVGGKVKRLNPDILDRLSGKTALKKARRSLQWDVHFGPRLERLESAILELHHDLDTNYNKFSPMTPHMDYVRDWVPSVPTSKLRLHFTSRAKPTEDPRNMMVQHVAVGTWYYKVPDNRDPNRFLEYRSKCQEMVYSHKDEEDEEEFWTKVPLRSSHGKAGGLNFVDNYITIVNERMENRYGTPADGPDCKNDQDRAPSLYAIADARHQYQPDFMISCIPCFFHRNGMLNHRVAFTQAPQHYPEYADKRDYLDNNNAQFFRLNAMIRDCCGGVSSCGTNGMWQIADRDPGAFWQHRLKRVRDKDGSLRTQLIEREQFHTSCKIEDTASSLDRVLVGEYSHFVNRKLSFGMSKDAEGFLGAQQRWVEGAITLCLQWVTNHADAHGLAKRNQPLLWLVILAFALYVGSLMRMVTKEYTSSIFVEYGLLSNEFFDTVVRKPLHHPIKWAYSTLMDARGGHTPNGYDYKVYEDMTLQFIVFMLTCVAMFFLLWILTNCCKCAKNVLHLPWEMQWWGRLVISFDNLTYWIWFWTSFFWIGFNVFLAVRPAHFHFNNVGMMFFMLVVTFLNYALIVANSLRFSIMESIDANEIAFLSMDNIWRANQLFFMVGPIQGFSVITGTRNFLNYLMYGKDIGGWSGGDLTQVSIMIVKYWTSAIIIASIACWVYLFTSDPSPDEYQTRRPGCIIFSFIAMDVMHPCIYLWTVGNDLSREELQKMPCLVRITSSRYWKKVAADVLLNEYTTNIFRYVGPAYNFMLPILVFYNSYFGVSGGFTLVAVGAGH